MVPGFRQKSLDKLPNCGALQFLILLGRHKAFVASWTHYPLSFGSFAPFWIIVELLRSDKLAGLILLFRERMKTGQCRDDYRTE
jgi:hypothetical protein